MRMSIGMKTFPLVYGTKTVLLIELEVQSLRVVLKAGILKNEWVRNGYEELALLDEKRL